MHVQPAGRFLQLSSKNVKSPSDTFTAASLVVARAQTAMISALISKQNEDEDIIIIIMPQLLSTNPQFLQLLEVKRATH